MFGSRPADEELLYRKHYLDNDIRQISAIIYAISALMFAFTLIDFSNLGASPQLQTGIVLRSVFMFSGFFLIWAMRAYRRPAVMDWGVTVYSACIAVGIVAFHLTGTISSVRVIAVVTVFIFAGYIAFPTYVAWMMMPVVILLLGEGYFIFSSDRADLLGNRSVIVAVALFAVYMGVIASAYHHRASYQSFRSMRQIKRLSGLLPICANCKKIRDDQGYYQQLEHYITQHSDVVFSHSICPGCLPLLYPELKNNG